MLVSLNWWRVPDVAPPRTVPKRIADERTGEGIGVVLFGGVAYGTVSQPITVWAVARVRLQAWGLAEVVAPAPVIVPEPVPEPLPEPTAIALGWMRLVFGAEAEGTLREPVDATGLGRIVWPTLASGEVVLPITASGRLSLLLQGYGTGEVQLPVVEAKRLDPRVIAMIAALYWEDA
jgi:hypothetical protein